MSDQLAPTSIQSISIRQKKTVLQCADAHGGRSCHVSNATNFESCSWSLVVACSQQVLGMTCLREHHSAQKLQRRCWASWRRLGFPVIRHGCSDECKSFSCLLDYSRSSSFVFVVYVHINVRPFWRHEFGVLVVDTSDCSWSCARRTGRNGGRLYSTGCKIQTERFFFILWRDYVAIMT